MRQFAVRRRHASRQAALPTTAVPAAQLPMRRFAEPRQTRRPANCKELKTDLSLNSGEAHQGPLSRADIKSRCADSVKLSGRVASGRAARLAYVTRRGRAFRDRLAWLSVVKAEPRVVENAFMTNDDLRPVYFLSDSTGITAETLGNTLLTQFPANNFDRITVPFITTVEQARTVVSTIDKLAATGLRPIVFSTAVSSDIRQALATCQGIIVDLIGTHVGQLEQALGSRASGEPGRAHGLGNAERYQSRMAAVEYAMEHDDGQSLRALEKAQVILVAPSRCGKTPTTMYLALQHGIFAANFPLVDEDFEREGLPKPLRPFVDKCFGLSSNPLRLSQIRTERRRGSPYASLRQCGFELRSAEQLYVSHGIPYLNSATVSVEEMAATILQRMNLKH